MRSWAEAEEYRPLRRRDQAADASATELEQSPARSGRLILAGAVAGIGAIVIVIGASLYASGAIGAPRLLEGPAVSSMEHRWEPDTAFAKALEIGALENVSRHTPPPVVEPPASSQASPSEGPARERDYWEPVDENPY